MEVKINDRLAARFYEQSPAILARLLHELGTEASVQLLLRDDLCCPLECFLLEVSGSVFPVGWLLMTLCVQQACFSKAAKLAVYVTTSWLENTNDSGLTKLLTWPPFPFFP